MGGVLAAAQASRDITWPDVAGLLVLAAFLVAVIWIVLRHG